MNYCRDCKHYLKPNTCYFHRCKLARPEVRIDNVTGKDENEGIYLSPIYIRSPVGGVPCERFEPSLIGQVRIFFREMKK